MKKFRPRKIKANYLKRVIRETESGMSRRYYRWLDGRFLLERKVRMSSLAMRTNTMQRLLKEAGYIRKEKY